MHQHGLGTAQPLDHAYPRISAFDGVLLHIRSIGVQNLADAQGPDEILGLPPHYTALPYQGLEQFQGLRQIAAVHQPAGFFKGCRTARPKGVIFPVGHSGMGAE